jgi:hypothetical protein
MSSRHTRHEHEFLGCAICDPIITAWCFAGAPSIDGLATKHKLTTDGPGLG